MQRMRPHIPPEAIQPNLPRRRPRTRNLKNPRRNSKRLIRRHNLDTGDPLRNLAALRSCEIALHTSGLVDGVDFCAGDIGKRFCGAQVCEEGAVALQDVGLFGARGGGVGGVGPGTRVLRGVGGGEVEGAEGDADVEVGEDELDAVLCWRSVNFRFVSSHDVKMGGTYVGRSRVAHGMLRILSMGALDSGSQPRASRQGTLTASILTLPDSVRRRPILSQLWEKMMEACAVGARAKMCLSVSS